MKRFTRFAVCCLAVLAALAIVSGLSGCSSGRPMGKVSGKVTLQGRPLTAGTVQFTNDKLGAGVSAVLDTEGSYRVETPVPTGLYEVTILPPPPPAPHEMDKAARLPRSNIPVKFQDPKTSGLSATIQEGANTADFAL
jgi:hypothetical protein